MAGTLRAHDPLVRSQLEARVRRIVEGVAAAYGARAAVRVTYGYPPVVNDAQLAHDFAQVALEAGIVVKTLPPTMGAEDFAYFAQRVPGVLVRLGIRNEQSGAVHSGHSAEFCIDEAALPVGVRTLVAFATAVAGGRLPRDHARS